MRTDEAWLWIKGENVDSMKAAFTTEEEANLFFEDLKYLHEIVENEERIAEAIERNSIDDDDEDGKARIRLSMNICAAGGFLNKWSTRIRKLIKAYEKREVRE